MAYLLVFLTFIICATVQYFLQHRRSLAKVSAAGAMALPAVGAAARSLESVAVGAGMDAGLLTHVPRGVFLAPGHTWLQLERSGGVRLGSDRFPLTALGELDRLDVVPEGTRVRQGDMLAELGSGERELRLLSPVQGTVTAVNDSLLAKPGDLHADPYERGWLCSIRPEGLAASLKRMFIAEETEEWMRSELRRLRDSLSSREGELIALADGGQPIQGLAGCLEPEEWDEFVERFFELPARPGSTS
jgi:glycine cleavage system H protein